MVLDGVRTLTGRDVERIHGLPQINPNYDSIQSIPFTQLPWLKHPRHIPLICFSKYIGVLCGSASVSEIQFARRCLVLEVRTTTIICQPRHIPTPLSFTVRILGIKMLCIVSPNSARLLVGRRHVFIPVALEPAGDMHTDTDTDTDLPVNFEVAG